MLGHWIWRGIRDNYKSETFEFFRLSSITLRTKRFDEKLQENPSFCLYDDLLRGAGSDYHITQLFFLWALVTHLQILCEVPASNNWNFDVQWSPGIPGVLSTSSYDGKIGIYNIEVSHKRFFVFIYLVWYAILLISCLN